jgi:hypothetical protein
LTTDSPAPSSIDYAGQLPGVPRPTSVTVLTSIGIVLGALGALCKPGGALAQLMIKMPQPNPVLDLFRNDPALRAYVIGNAATGTLISILLLMSSLGGLLLKRWARGGMLAYAALAVMMTLINVAIGHYLVGPEVQRVIRQSGMPEPPGNAMMSGPVGIVLTLLVGLWYPVLIFMFFTRPRAKEAFERGLPRVDI